MRSRWAEKIPSVDGSRVQIFTQWFFTFVGVNLAWIFFRADSLSGAITIIRRLGADWSGYLTPNFLNIMSEELNIQLRSLLGLAGLLLFTIVLELKQGNEPIEH